MTIKNRENESLVFALHSKFDPQNLKSVLWASRKNDVVSFTPRLLCTMILHEVIRMDLPLDTELFKPSACCCPTGCCTEVAASCRRSPPPRPAGHCSLEHLRQERRGKSMVGSGWEQGSYNRNVGTSSLREAGEAGRRRNLSRKRTFIADTSKNTVSSHWRNVSSIGNAAALACRSFRWLQRSRKSVWQKCFCFFPVESSHAKRKTRQRGTTAAPRDMWHPLLAGWWC